MSKTSLVSASSSSTARPVDVDVHGLLTGLQRTIRDTGGLPDADGHLLDQALLEEDYLGAGGALASYDSVEHLESATWALQDLAESRRLARLIAEEEAHVNDRRRRAQEQARAQAAREQAASVRAWKKPPGEPHRRPPPNLRLLYLPAKAEAHARTREASAHARKRAEVQRLERELAQQAKSEHVDAVCAKAKESRETDKTMLQYMKLLTEEEQHALQEQREKLYQERQATQKVVRARQKVAAEKARLRGALDRRDVQEARAALEAEHADEARRRNEAGLRERARTRKHVSASLEVHRASTLQQRKRHRMLVETLRQRNQQLEQQAAAAQVARVRAETVKVPAAQRTRPVPVAASLFDEPGPNAPHQAKPLPGNCYPRSMLPLLSREQKRDVLMEDLLQRWDQINNFCQRESCRAQPQAACPDCRQRLHDWCDATLASTSPARGPRSAAAAASRRALSNTSASRAPPRSVSANPRALAKPTSATLKTTRLELDLDALEAP